MKKYLFILVPMFIGIGCSIAYNIIGSHVEQSGLLVEPFALVPLSYFFFFISVVSYLIVTVRYLIKK